MKVWKLSPTGDSSGKNGYIRIRAENETRAREIAEQAFAKSKVKTMHSAVWSTLDWTDTNLVQCINESEDMSKTEGILDIQ
jgi:hypothetical protein